MDAEPALYFRRFGVNTSLYSASCTDVPGTEEGTPNWISGYSIFSVRLLNLVISIPAQPELYRGHSKSRFPTSINCRDTALPCPDFGLY